jgi:antitoxin ParD1/3/4
MNIILPPELEEMVYQKVKLGIYNSPSEVIHEGLRRLQEEDELIVLRREKLRREILKGMEQMQNEQYKSYDSAAELVEDIIRKGKEELAKKLGE